MNTIRPIMREWNITNKGNNGAECGGGFLGTHRKYQKWLKGNAWRGYWIPERVEWRRNCLFFVCLSDELVFINEILREEEEEGRFTANKGKVVNKISAMVCTTKWIVWYVLCSSYFILGKVLGTYTELVWYIKLY